MGIDFCHARCSHFYWYFCDDKNVNNAKLANEIVNNVQMHRKIELTD